MNYKEALKLATLAHSGQVRKKTGESYITHPVAIADKFYTRDYKVVSVLHDVVEDTTITLENLENRGLSKDLVYVLNLLTHRSNESYLTYILNVKSSNMARLIKIEDLKYNLINPLNRHQEDKYKMALYILRGY